LEVFQMLTDNYPWFPSNFRVGIAYHLDHMEEGKEFITKLFGGEKVTFCYNPTKQAHIEDLYGYVSDLTQAGTQKLGMITSEVNALVQFLREAVAAVGQRGVVVHIAHSQGALITSLAAKQLTPLEMSQIEVLAFGGAAAIRKTAQTPFRRCINYYTINDPLLFVVPSAAQALRSGLVSDDEFCFLAPRLGDPVADHNLIGPTYAQALEWEGMRFQMEHRSLMYRIVRRILLMLIAVLSSLTNRLDELLKGILRPVLAWCIFCHKNTSRTFDMLTAKIKDNFLRPLVVLATLLLEWVLERRRSFTGEDKYVPVTPKTIVFAQSK
jgi:hypothetical protein